MATHLAKFFRRRRITSGLRYGELARSCGYKNIAKGCNRIQRFEARGEIDLPLLVKLGQVLAISDEDISGCIAADKANWERWADEPIEPHLVVRLMAAVYSDKRIPTELHASRDAMEQFASQFAEEKRLKVCLVLSRRLRCWFDGQGTKYSETHDTFQKSYAPFMRLPGSGKKFLLNFNLL